MVMVLSTSGCVDIYGARGVFGGKTPPGPVVYREKLKAQVEHVFDTNIADPGTWNFAGSDSAVVKKGTRSLSINIDITIFTIPFDIPGYTLPERYVHVQVSGADGSMWIDARYVNSTTAPETITALNPLDGPWAVHVDAAGIGRQTAGLADTFKVMMSVNEPV
jgi:hypothetical protein